MQSDGLKQLHFLQRCTHCWEAIPQQL